MSTLRYPAWLEKSADGCAVSFPDLPGCIAGGESLEQAYEAAQDALALHLETLINAGEELPAPSPSEELEKPEVEGAVVYLLLVTAAEPAVSERVNVWLPKLLIQRIDRAVARAGGGESRSGFLAKAARLLLATGPEQVLSDRVAEIDFANLDFVIGPKTPVYSPRFPDEKIGEFREIFDEVIKEAKSNLIFSFSNKDVLATKNTGAAQVTARRPARLMVMKDIDFGTAWLNEKTTGRSTSHSTSASKSGQSRSKTKS